MSILVVKPPRMVMVLGYIARSAVVGLPSFCQAPFGWGGGAGRGSGTGVPTSGQEQHMLPGALEPWSSRTTEFSDLSKPSDPEGLFMFSTSHIDCAVFYEHL